MVIQSMLDSGQNTKDNINPRDTTKDLILKRNEEEIFIEENTTIIQTRDTSSDTLWGTGIWGTSLWDGTYNNSFVDQRIINPNNVFREHFRDSDFINLSDTTANIDAVNFKITF